MLRALNLNMCIKAILKRCLAGGGFAERIGGSYRPDSIAWAVLALKASGMTSDIIDAARNRLQESQVTDGRVCMPGDNGAFWPTPLAILAWQGSSNHREAQSRATRFLLKTSGRHWKKKPDSPSGHDSSICWWP